MKKGVLPAQRREGTFFDGTSNVIQLRFSCYSFYKKSRGLTCSTTVQQDEVRPLLDI